MAYDPVSAAMSGLSGSIERFGGMIGKSVSEKAGRQLEEAKFARGLEAEKQQSQLRGMNIERIGMQLDEQRSAAASDAEDFLIAPVIQKAVEEIVPEPLPPQEQGGVPGGMQVNPPDPNASVDYEKKITASLTIKKWIAKQLPTVMASVLPGAELRRNEEGNHVLFSETFGKNLTNGDMKRIPDFKEKMGMAMSGLMSRERILKTLSASGDPKATEKLAEYNDPARKLQLLQEEKAFRETIVTITGERGWDKTAALKGVADTQKDIDKEEAKWGPLAEDTQGGKWQKKGSTGEIIRRAAPPVKPGDETGSIARRKAAISAAYPDLDDQTVTGLATKTITLSHNPVTDRVTLVDMVKMTARPLGAPPEEAKPLMPDILDPDKGPTIFEMREYSTGAISGLVQAYNLAAGMVGLPLGSKKVAGSRQFAETSQMGLVRALSINRRFPVGEINRIREEVKIAPAFWDNPKLLQERIRSIDRSLRIRLDGERKASTNLKLPAESRKDALDATKDISNFLKILGNPPTFKDPSDPAFEALPKGSQFYFGDELKVKN